MVINSLFDDNPQRNRGNRKEKIIETKGIQTHLNWIQRLRLGWCMRGICGALLAAGSLTSCDHCSLESQWRNLAELFETIWSFWLGKLTLPGILRVERNEQRGI